MMELEYSSAIAYNKQGLNSVTAYSIVGSVTAYQSRVVETQRGRQVDSVKMGIYLLSRDEVFKQKPRQRLF